VNLLFDLDGTLCDPRVGIMHGFRHAYEVLARPCPDEGALAGVIGLPLTACFERFGVTGADAREAAHHFQAFFEGRGFAEAHLYDGVLDGLLQLKARGHGLAVVSAKPTFAVKFVTETLGIVSCFDGLFGCAPQELTPLKTPILAEALRTLGWRPSDCLFIGDRDQDRDAARAHGVPFVAAAWGFGAAEEHAGALARMDSFQAFMEWMKARG
jgi:phosphoglycolate phosphatase